MVTKSTSGLCHERINGLEGCDGGTADVVVIVGCDVAGSVDDVGGAEGADGAAGADEEAAAADAIGATSESVELDLRGRGMTEERKPESIL